MLRLLKCLPGAAFSALAFITLAPAQTPQPAQSATTTQEPSKSGVTLHSATQLVIVDVVVTDSQQNPVHNLSASDFTLLEKNVPQQIKHFEEHKALLAAEAAKLQPVPRMPPGVFTNYSPLPLSGTVNVLLLDALNTPMQDQAYVRDQLRKYLKNASPGARVAIFGLTSRLILLQGFTSDPELLKTAIDQKTPRAFIRHPQQLRQRPGLGRRHRQSPAVRSSGAILPATAARTLHPRCTQPDRPQPPWHSRPKKPHLVLRLLPNQHSARRRPAEPLRHRSQCGRRVSRDHEPAHCQPGRGLSHRCPWPDDLTQLKRRQLRQQIRPRSHQIQQRRGEVLPADGRRAQHHAPNGRGDGRPRVHQHQRSQSGRRRI